ncbi:MAG: SgcJ/EcaC family oxidoreductase [Vicinamibacterales bacterium]
MRVTMMVVGLALLGSAAVGAQAAGDETAIRDVVRRYVEARTAEDPTQIEALFTADADQHTTAGEWRRGREQVVPGTLRSSANNPGTRRIVVEAIRFVTPDVAIVDGPYEIGDPPNVRRNWTTLVMKREAGGWRIAAIRNALPRVGN